LLLPFEGGEGVDESVVDVAGAADVKRLNTREDRLMAEVSQPVSRCGLG